MTSRKHSKEEMLELRAQGFSNRQIAEKLGITARTVVYNIGPQYGPQNSHTIHRPDIKNEDILALREQGMTHQAIADKLGTSRATVSKRLERLLKATPEPKQEPEQVPKVIHPDPVAAPQTIETLRTTRNPIPTDLFEFAYCPGWHEQLWRLAGRAIPEPWCFKNNEWVVKQPETAILDNYLRTTFKLRAIEYNTEPTQDLNKIIHVRNGLATFHTGLYTTEYKGLYACFLPNRAGASHRDWVLMGFETDTAPAFKNVTPLPEHRQTSLGNKPFNPYWEVRINQDHIFGNPENIARFPESARAMWNLPLIVEAALLLARKKAVITPQEVIISPKLDKRAYLLPLFVTSPDKPDVVAVLEEMDGYYHMRTCFTLQQAYLNARIHGRPTVSWLTDIV